MSRNDNWPTLREGLLIKEARKKNKETQEAFAEYMDVDVKTVGNWETGRTTPGWQQKKRLATHLSIPFEQLGLVSETDFTPETASVQLSEAKSFFDDGAFTSARSTCEVLVSNLTRQIKAKATNLLPSFEHALYFAGHATSIANEPAAAFAFFKTMEEVARELQDNNLLCLALTYQGEMYRRQKKYDEAIATLTSAPHGLDVDVYIRGNWAQLLARTYGKIARAGEAIGALRLAEELAFQSEKRTSNIYICYNICSVYEEYARFYMHIDAKQSLHYIELAEANMPPASRWNIPLKLTKGEILMRSVAGIEVREPRLALRESDYEAGKKLVLAAIHLAQEFGHKRQEWHATRLPARLRLEQDKWGCMAQDLERSFAQENLLDSGDY